MAKPARRFSAHSDASEVTEGMDLSGKRVVVTGGNAGIGLATVEAFVRIGADVTIAARDEARASLAVRELRATLPGAAVRTQQLDLADRSSIARFVAHWSGPLDILVNNAGVMALPHLERTADGWEMQFAINHLGHFELALGLLPALAATGAARIVALSSSGHLFSPVMFDDLHFHFQVYDPIRAYGQSKSATALFAVEATRRWAKHGITANAVMPGAIATGLQKHTGGLRAPPARRKSPEQGAATTLYAATAPELAGIGGRYLEDCAEAPMVAERDAALTGVAPYALDPANAARLWNVSLDLLGQSRDGQD